MNKLQKLQQFSNQLKDKTKLKNLKIPIKIRDSKSLNACARISAGIPFTTHIAINQGAYDVLNYKELKGVVEHELGHVLEYYHSPTVLNVSLLSFGKQHWSHILLYFDLFLGLIVDTQPRIPPYNWILGSLILIIWATSIGLAWNSCKFSRELEFHADYLGGKLAHNYEDEISGFTKIYQSTSVLKHFAFFICDVVHIADHPSLKFRIQRLKVLSAKQFIRYLHEQAKLEK